MVYPFAVSNYNEKLVSILRCSTDIRSCVVRLAQFMIYDFPKIPYFWGGGHAFSYFDFLGVCEIWGKEEAIQEDGCSQQKVGEKMPFSFDCSGFVTWCFINAGFPIASYVRKDVKEKGFYCLDSADIYKMGKKIKITDSRLFSFAKVGDIAWMEGHVGILVELDSKNKTISVVHVSLSGEGSNLTKMSTVTGLVVEDDLGEMKSSAIFSRVGESYFTHIVSISYSL